MSADAMEEEQIFIDNNGLVIEGLLTKAAQESGVVICHPHSLMGGSMHNNVVEAIKEAFAQENYSTLRFNFRGVGRSTGMYSEGKGEQEDIIAVCKYLKHMGIVKLFFAGYSFGSWVGSQVIQKDDNPFTGSIFVSPPVNYFDFDFTKLINKINVIICGSKDQFCDLDILKEQAKKIKSNLNITAVPMLAEQIQLVVN
jgi:alpha/beta superfamily hydrolase